MLTVQNMYSKPKAYSDTKEEALDKFNSIRSKADKKHSEILTKYKALKKELGFDIEYHIDGDTHGIHEEYQYIGFTLEGHTFEYPIKD